MKKSTKALIVGIAAFGVAITSAIAPATVPVHAEELISPNKELISPENQSSAWIQVSPVSARVVLKPGTELDYAMTVSNVGTEAFNYTVYAAPYTIVDENYNVSLTVPRLFVGSSLLPMMVL